MAFDDANSEVTATPHPSSCRAFAFEANSCIRSLASWAPHHIGTGLWSEYVRKRRGSKAQIHFMRNYKMLIVCTNRTPRLVDV